MVLVVGMQEMFFGKCTPKKYNVGKVGLYKKCYWLTEHDFWWVTYSFVFTASLLIS